MSGGAEFHEIFLGACWTRAAERQVVDLSPTANVRRDPRPQRELAGCRGGPMRTSMRLIRKRPRRRPGTLDVISVARSSLAVQHHVLQHLVDANAAALDGAILVTMHAVEMLDMQKRGGVVQPLLGGQLGRVGNPAVVGRRGHLLHSPRCDCQNDQIQRHPNVKQPINLSLSVMN